MAQSCSIDATFHSEERYSKISLAYIDKSDKEAIENAIQTALKHTSIEPNIYDSEVTEGKSVIVVEFHDDYDREGGDVFDEILKILGIKVCQ